MLESDVASASTVVNGDGRCELTIGELAKASHVTIRTLRHFDRLELLKPTDRPRFLVHPL